MDFKEMSVEELMERRAAIPAELDAPEADLDALEAEVRGINDELEARKAAEAQRNEIRAAVAAGDVGEIIEEKEIIEERKEDKMDIEIRNTPEYIDAFAKYVKTGNDAECRALLTENASGSIAVPELVYDTVKTAWEREGVMRLVKKSYLKGNLKVGFEISSSEAVAHTEGVAVDEENLVLGVVSLVPQAIKKWISISDEALDMASVPYLQYIYDELTYRIAKKAADTLVAKIVAAGTASTTTAVGVPVFTSSALISDVAQAMSKLAGEATSPAIIMNRASWGAFKAAQAAASYAYDPFEGLPVVFNDTLTAYSAATTGVTFAIVGDLANGALANFPAGEEITVKRDDYTLATSDLVRFIGREYVALGIVAPNHFVKITK